MTAADQLDTLVARPEVDMLSKLQSELKPNPKSTTTAIQTHLQRRSSFQKIMHICNQGYSAFPHILIRLQDVQTTVSIDFVGLIQLFRSTFLTVAVSLSVIALFSQFLFVVGLLCSTGSGFLFPLTCTLILGIMAFKCFTVTVAKPVHRSLSCRKKID